MKLTHQVVELRLRDTFTTSHSRSDFRRNILLSLDDGSGIIGRGEAAPYYGEKLDAMTADLDRIAGELGEGGFDRIRLDGVASSVRAAIECARLDRLAQLKGVTLCELTGGDPTVAVETSFTLGQAQPEEMSRKAEAAKAWRVLKIKVGTPHDRENLHRIRAACPGATLRVDANGGWPDPATAAARIAELAPLGIEFVEQPLPPGNLEAYRALKRSVKLPIYVDESIRCADDVRRHAGIVDGIVVKLGKCAGIVATLECIAAARAAGMKVMIGCMVESTAGIAAACHIAGRCDSADLDGHLLLAEDPFEGLDLVDGRLRLSGRPGLGISARTRS